MGQATYVLLRTYRWTLFEYPFCLRARYLLLQTFLRISPNEINLL